MLVGDPVRDYGRQAAAEIMATLASVPDGERSALLRLLLDKLEAGLYGRTMKLASEIRGTGVPPVEALHRALAASLAEGLVRELAVAGKTGRLGGRLELGRLSALGWNPLSAVSGALGRLLGSSPVRAGARAAGKAFDKLGDLACAAVNNPLAGPAATAYNPAAGAGVAVAQGRCQKPVPYVPPPEPTTPSWVLPVAIAGGAAIVLFAVMR